MRTGLLKKRSSRPRDKQTDPERSLAWEKEAKVKKFITCPNCGQKLFKAEIGSMVDIICPSCKQPFEVTVSRESVVTIDRSVNKPCVKTA